MRGGDHEERVDPRAALGTHGAIAYEHDARPGAHGAGRGGREPAQRVARILGPVAVRLEDDRHAAALRRELGDEIVDEPGARGARDRAQVVERDRALWRVAAEQERDAELDPGARAAGAIDGGPRPDDDAGGEVLDLALAVDRRIGDHGDRFLQVVREVRALHRERRERAVVPERADELVPRLLHERGLLHVLGLVAERGKLLLATDREVLDLVGHDAELYATARPRRAVLGGDRRSTGLESPAIVGRRAAALRAQRDEARAKDPLVEVPPATRRPLKCGVLARSERPGVGAVALQRDEPALAREDVGLVGLDVPQRTEAHGVDADEAQVPHPCEERGRPLRERTECRARSRVRVLGLRIHPPDLAHDRREQQLQCLDRVEATSEHEAAQRRVDVLRIAAITRERDVERVHLVAQARDRVDLAVVRERGERLDALEARRRVGRVAVVPERH